MPAAAAIVAPRRRAYRWSSGTLPRTKRSRAFSYYAGWYRPSAKPGADIGNIANAEASPVHRRVGSRNAGIRNRPANGTQPSTLGKPLRSRTSTGIPSRSWERAAAAPQYTTACGLLKQPYKQELPCLMISTRHHPRPRPSPFHPTSPCKKSHKSDLVEALELSIQKYSKTDQRKYRSLYGK